MTAKIVTSACTGSAVDDTAIELVGWLGGRDIQTICDVARPPASGACINRAYAKAAGLQQIPVYFSQMDKVVFAPNWPVFYVLR